MLSKEEVLEEGEEKRKLYLPLEKLDKCTVCNQTAGKLRLCAACGEIIYCSSECQGNDWPSHKTSCGKTDRIDLEAFYPFLAFLAEAARHHGSIPRHTAQAHHIIHYPGSTQPMATFPGQSPANLVLLGEGISRESDDIRLPLVKPNEVESWWPTPDIERRASSSLKLRRTGYVMPILLSTSISLITDMYSTTSIRASDSPDKKAKRRIRLQYKKSPISDFGLVKCKARVSDSAQFAYYAIPDGPLEFGPDPEAHFALYFTTLSGEEAFLDFNLYPFDITISIKNAGYTDGMPLDPANGPITSAPALFIDKNTGLYKAPIVIQKKYSILRNEVIQKAVVHEWPELNCRALAAVTESILGKRCTDSEIRLIECWALDAAGSLNLMLSRRGWTKWPVTPELTEEIKEAGMEESPREKVGWVDYVQDWCRRNEREVVSREVLLGSFKAFKERQRLSLESSRVPDPPKDDDMEWQ